MLRRNFNGFIGIGIARHARRAKLHLECTEAAEGDILSFRKRLRYGYQEPFYHIPGLKSANTGEARYMVYDL